jgi:hypothetical protein
MVSGLDHQPPPPEPPVGVVFVGVLRLKRL